MQRIIQVKEKEYDELFEKANLNNESIAVEAQKLYEERGTFAIDLKMEIGNYQDKIRVVSNGYISDWNDKYPLKSEDKKKILNFTKQRAEELFEGMFGDVIYNVNRLKEEKNKYETRRKLLTHLTILGWTVALMMTSIILYRT
tara:strand:+ start:1652 stop:2080 length:429 start_codon:yes stop_codon:yes gene_type:complete